MKIKILFATLLTLALCTAGHAQTLDKAKLDQFFDRLAEKNKAMGSLTIARDGNVLYTRAIGFSQINGTEEKPLTAANRFRIGSITKMYTATMILQLVEEGKLKLTDTLDKFFPQVPNAQKITIAQILAHRSGIPNVRRDRNSQANVNTTPITKDEMLALIVKATPDFEPDTKHSYSNSGYFLLGLILEKLTGKSYEEALAWVIGYSLVLGDWFWCFVALCLRGESFGSRMGTRLCVPRWRDIRVSSKEILPVVFVFDACQSGKVHPVNGGCAASRLVGLKVRVDPFIRARTQQPQGFVCPLCQTLAGRRIVPGVGESDIQPARLSQWKSRRARRHPANLPMHVMTDPHDDLRRSAPKSIHNNVDQIVRQPIPINGLNSAKRWRRRVSRVRRCRSFGERCELLPLDEFFGRRRDRSQRPQGSFGFILAAGVAETHENAAFAGSQIERRLERIGRLIHQFAKKPQHHSRIADRIMNIASRDGADRMKLALEGRRYAKIRAGAAQRPEKVGITFGVSGKNASVRGHNSSGKQIVARSAVQSGEPAQSAAKDDTARANSGTLSEHRREPMPTRCPRHLAAQHATFGAGRSPQRIDRNPLHSGEINDQAVRTSPSQVTVPACARCHFQFMTPRKLHSSQRILLVRALHDDPRPPLRCCVPIKDPPRAFVGGIGGENQTSFEFGAQPVDSAATEVIVCRLPEDADSRWRTQVSPWRRPFV